MNGESLKAVIIDDQAPQRKLLEAYSKKSKKVEILGSFESIEKWTSSNTAEPPDLILLDVEIPETTGLDYLRSTANLPQIILVTNHRNYAVEAFEFEVTDYVVKPYTYSRFLQAIEKVQRNLDSVLENKAIQKRTSEGVFVKVGFRLINIKVNQITHLESLKDKVKIYLKEGDSKIANTTLKSLFDELSGKGFLMVHRRFVVCIDCIDELLTSDLMINGHVVPISRRRKQDVIDQLRLI